MLKLMLTLKTAFNSLLANKLRSSLTMLGIIIGVAAVVMMISIGNSASSAVTSAIEGLGSNVIFIFNTPSAASSKSLSEQDLFDIKRLPYVEQAIPELQSPTVVSYLGKEDRFSLLATVPEYESVRNSHPLFGRFITISDIESLSKVAVIGYNLYEEFFDTEQPIGKIIKINGVPFTVIGVLEKKGGSPFGQSPDDVVIIPLSTAQQRLFGEKRIDLISVQVSDEKIVPLVSDEIDSMLKRKYNISSEEDSFYRIFTQEDILSVTGTVTGILTILLAGIASISLLVGGIGIMNIMLVSVTERTREIGIRKAVGARKRDILVQFLTEALVLCIIGGTTGTIIGITGSHLIARIGNWEPVIGTSTILLAFGFSAAVGVFFGLYPAYKAANLHPIEALRYE